MKIALLALLACDVARAHAESYSLDIGSHVRALGDTSAAIVASDALAGSRVTIGRSLTTVATPWRDIDVGLFARWVFARVDGAMFRDLQSNLTQHALTAGVRLDATLWWRLRGVAQAELGMARTALAVTDSRMMVPVDDHGWAPYGTATLGSELGLHESARFRLAIGVDVGYTITAPVELRALPRDRPDPDLAIDTDYASIGTLDTRGWTFSMALRGTL